MALGAVTITSSVDSSTDAVVLVVTPPVGATSLFLSRHGPSSSEAYVRGCAPLALTGGAVTVRDYEAPIGVALVYTAHVTDATSSSDATTTITVPSQGCSDTWLTDLGVSANTQRIIIESLQELSYDVPVGVHWIIDRRSPITSGDVAHTPTFELNFLTETEQQRLKARAALGNGTPVLLRTPPEDGIGSVYFTVTGWREQRIVNQATVTDRRFAVSGVQVDRPDPMLFGASGIPWPPPDV